ncbi:unnamed protein product [Allacma fusca]|uniref:SMB domain-containing protein n=1 Tax=Allacma fusca TaxID=39272 RepID=A0A8J2K448_9HEXA|nr:unnamed protein product [Allacma fusca]
MSLLDNYHADVAGFPTAKKKKKEKKKSKLSGQSFVSSGSSPPSFLFLQVQMKPSVCACLASMSSSTKHKHSPHRIYRHGAETGIFFTLLVLASSIVVISGQFGPFADIQGEFCRKRIGGCCPGRLDECSTPILGTLCYCDHFCNRTDNPDCCPDFWEFCLGISRPSPPPDDVILPRCFHNGQYFDYEATTKINCNQCKCDRSPSDPSEMEFLCERDPCMIDPGLIDTVNEGNYDWTSSNYSEFWGRKLSDGILYRLGTLEPERAVKNMEPIKYVYDESTLPREFDARDNWRGLIQPVKDQGWCGSDWAMTTTTITADRLAIQSKGSENVDLSTQHMITCNSRGQQGCTGGHLDRAWNFMRRFGVVDESCYPYESGVTGTTGNCLISRKIKSLRELNQCRVSNQLSGRSELYRSQPAYRISPKESDIKYEIMTFGPVQAVMNVPADFFMYRGGIYRKSGLRTGERVGYHSVRIVGWGEEFHEGRMAKYWLVANTWGTGWGEEGYFKIARGENEYFRTLPQVSAKGTLYQQ